MARALKLFSAFRADDVLTRETMTDWYGQTGMMIDPHTAVGLAAAKQVLAAEPELIDSPLISLACAHPAKFPDAVEMAIGRRQALPEYLGDLHKRTERATSLAADRMIIKDTILQRLAKSS